MGIFIPALMALAFPVKESVGGLLLYLVVGDLFAAFYYGRSAAFSRAPHGSCPGCCWGSPPGR